MFHISDRMTDTTVASLLEGRDAAGAGVLANVRFGTYGAGPTLAGGAVELPIHMTHGRQHEFTETWSAAQAVTTGRYEELVYAHDDERLFCAGYIPASGGYARDAERAYSHIFELTDQLGFPDLFRMWNYLGSINDPNESGMETYRDFCVGRAEAFAFHGKDMPAATGAGSLGDGLSFYLLSGRMGSATHIENPHQVPAYRYPVRYGPKAPSFARATYLAQAGGNGESQRLFISGTASIIGHETQHVGDVEAQCYVALSNIDQLISAANLERHDVRIKRDDLRFDAVKVYVRRSTDIPLVASRCARYFDDRETSIAYLNVDICRSDLLVEIEAIASVRAQQGYTVE
ncbi:pteridine-dependent deoxygenase [Actinocorallia longicatena]|uniref:Pteridine-dependent deoxygenase n=1 Tax=Actinocorallia longicatena TaxID=111803 RepID=A0ABP6QC70_9ACTN